MQPLEQDLGYVPAMNTAAGTYAEFRSLPMIVCWEQVVDGNGMILRMPMLLKYSQVSMLYFFDRGIS